MKLEFGETDLGISGAVFFNDPTSFSAECFQDLVIVTVFGKTIVPLRSKSGVDLCGDGSSSPLSSLVVLSLLPRREPSRRTAAGHFFDCSGDFLFSRVQTFCYVWIHEDLEFLLIQFVELRLVKCILL